MPLRPFVLRLPAFLAAALLFLAAPVISSGDAAGRNFRFVADGGIIGSPAVEDDGTVFCVTDGGSLVRIRPDGRLAWSRDTGGRPRLFLRMKDGGLVVVFAAGGFEAYNPEGGRAAAAESPRRGTAPLAVFETPEGRLLFAYPDGVFVVTTAEGRRLLSWKAPGPLSCVPAVEGGRVACAVRSGDILVYRLSGRREPGPPSGAPAAALAWTAEGNLAAGREDGGFFLFSPGGEILFEKKLPFTAAEIHPVPEGRFFLAGEGGGLHLLTDGKAVPAGKPGRKVAGAVSGSGGLFFAAFENGDLDAYEPSGARLWTTVLAGRPGRPALSAGGRFLAAGSADWVVHLFEFVRYGTGPEDGAIHPEITAGSGAETREDEYRKDYDFLYLLAGASSPAAYRKGEVLDELEMRFAEGAFGRSLPYASDILQALAAEPYSGGRKRDYADIRLRAVSLLGRLGSSRDMEFLAGLLLREKDDAVIPGILEAMGNLRSDPQGGAGRSILRFLEKSPLPPDARTAESLAGALEKIVSRRGRASPENAAAAARLLSAGNQPPQLRERLLQLGAPAAAGGR